MGCKAVVMLDADGQHFTKDIPRIAEAALSGDSDLVIGSRFLENNGNGNIPLYRQFGQKTLDLFTNIGSRQSVTDSQSGYRALSCKALNYIDFAIRRLQPRIRHDRPLFCKRAGDYGGTD